MLSRVRVLTSTGRRLWHPTLEVTERSAGSARPVRMVPRGSCWSVARRLSGLNRFDATIVRFAVVTTQRGVWSKCRRRQLVTETC